MCGETDREALGNRARTQEASATTSVPAQFTVEQPSGNVQGGGSVFLSVIFFPLLSISSFPPLFFVLSFLRSLSFWTQHVGGALLKSISEGINHGNSLAYSIRSVHSLVYSKYLHLQIPS